MKARHIEYIFMAKNLIVGISLLIVAALPLGSMGGVDADSIYSIIVNAFKNTPKTDFAYYAFYFSFAIIIQAVFHLIYLDRDKHHKALGTIISVIMYVISGTALAIGIARISEIYGYTSTPLFPMIISFTAIDVVFIIVEYFIFRNITQNPDKTETSDMPANPEENIARAETPTISANPEEIIGDAETPGTSENPEEIHENNKTHNKSKASILAPIFTALVIVVAIFFDFHYQADEFIDTGYSSVGELEIGDIFSGVVGFDDNYLSNVENGAEHTFNYKSCAYIYRKKKTDELLNDKNRQINELMPASASEEDIKIYANEIKRLQTEIQDITSNFNTFTYTEIKVTVVGNISYPDAFSTNRYGKIIEIIYNTRCNGNSVNDSKWDNTENKRIFGKQSIELSKTDFAEGTDFYSEKISATIHYYDGSFKKSYITPTNYTELNNATKGEQILKWTDSWGSYEYRINIV